MCSKYDVKEQCTEVSNELNKVNDWSNINKLSLNLNLMLFLNSKSSVNVPITIKNTIRKSQCKKSFGKIYWPELDMETSSILCAK